MIELIAVILVLAIATEAVVEILLESELFEWFRSIMRKTDFTAALISCGWCLSVWVAAFWCGMLALGAWWLALPFAVHRLSNWLHDLTHRQEEI